MRSHALKLKSARWNLGIVRVTKGDPHQIIPVFFTERKIPTRGRGKPSSPPTCPSPTSSPFTFSPPWQSMSGKPLARVQRRRSLPPRQEVSSLAGRSSSKRNGAASPPTRRMQTASRPSAPRHRANKGERRDVVACHCQSPQCARHCNGSRRHLDASTSDGCAEAGDRLGVPKPA